MLSSQAAPLSRCESDKFAGGEFEGRPRERIAQNQKLQTGWN